MRPARWEESAFPAEARDAMLAHAARPHRKGSLAAWCEAGPPGEHGPLRLRKWQRAYLRRLQRFSADVQAATSPRLNVSVPTQEGKSELTRRWLSWHMANYGDSVGYGCYSGNLATEMSIATRELLRSPQALSAWPHLAGEKADELDETTGQKIIDRDDDWSIPSREGRRNPRFIAVGVGGGSGRTLAIFAVDDAFKNETEYGSGAERAKVRQWLRSVVTARVRSRGGGVVVVGTRYGADDAHGVLAQWAATGGIPVDVFNVPLRAGENDDGGRDPGEYVSEIWTPALEAQTRLELGERMSAAMLDGRPMSDVGGSWKPAWFSHRYTGTPEENAAMADYTVLALDGAETAGGGDNSVLVWWGVFGNKARKLKQWRQQVEFPELLALARDQHEACKPNAFVIEKASSGTQVAQVLAREIPGVIPVVVSKSKRVRYNAVSPLWEAGNMEYPAKADWMGGYVTRMLEVTGEGDEVDDEADADSLFAAWWQGHDGEISVGDVLAGMRSAGW